MPPKKPAAKNMPPKKPAAVKSRATTYAVSAVAGLLAAGFSVFYIHKHIEGMGKQLEQLTKQLNASKIRTHQLESVQKELRDMAKSKKAFEKGGLTFSGFVWKLVAVWAVFYTFMWMVASGGKLKAAVTRSKEKTN